MRVIFTLSSGRSGTRYLCGLFRHNVACVCRHEPYLDWGNPTMFGRPIYERAVGNLAAVRQLAVRKKAWIERRAGPLYIETSHAFLKSWWDVAPDFFDDCKLIHLIRDPRKTAKSEANRHDYIERRRLPFRHYRVNRERFFRWSLTGREPIFSHFGPGELTRFQWYVVQWIEIENRAMSFLDDHQKHGDCVTLHAPHELNNPERVAAMFDALGVPMRFDPPRLLGNQNRTPQTQTLLTEEDEQQFAAVLTRLPASYLAIFHREPYTSLPWSAVLRAAQLAT